MEEEHIRVIVLTGGPCAGKTTVMSYLTQKLTDLGYTVITVSEAATELILSGLGPRMITHPEFQQLVLRHIIEKEDRWKEAARLVRSNKKVILCDRGVVDVAAYTSAGGFEAMLQKLQLSIVDARDARYDAVVFLRSVAVDVPEIYTCVNNAARRETVEEARKLDERTMEVWNGHPHLRIVDNSTSLDGKLLRALKVVCRALGIPVPIEIEKKYLVRSFNMIALPSHQVAVHIEQHYLKSADPAMTERVRARGQSGSYIYFHTMKRQIRPGVRSEIERQITKAEYLELLHRVDPAFGMIDKIRRCFVWENQYFELDAFDRGLVLLEIELTEEHDRVTLPPFLHDVVDVTDDPRYTNAEIARRIANGQRPL